MNMKEFYEKLAQSYPEEMLGMSSPGGVALYQFVCSELDKMHGSLIDLGCGKGRFVLYYSKRQPDENVLGVDIAGSNVKVGRLRVELAQSSNAKFIEADITEPLDVPPFDNLICIETMEHLPELGCLLDNIKRSVVPGGTAIVTTPCQTHKKDGYILSNKYLKEFGITDNYYHCGYSLAELAALFKDDFEIDRKFILLNKSVLIMRRLA